MRINKKSAVFFAFLISVSAWAVAYPMGPDSRLTTGSLCEDAVTERYAEHVAYCGRKVSFEKKLDIIGDYEALGYDIKTLGRENFKIDHLIPLCVGGSNEVNNLWPQYKDVYIKTDRIEALVCQLMSLGKMTQNEAVTQVLDAKKNLDIADDIEAALLKSLNTETQ